MYNKSFVRLVISLEFYFFRKNTMLVLTEIVRIQFPELNGITFIWPYQ